jgi:hypothetical protein
MTDNPVSPIERADPRNPWRQFLRPAKFRDAPFFVESSAKSSGRRIVEHEFPKKNTPYAEDMGRHAFKVSVRAYVIQYPSNSNQGVPGVPGYNAAYPLLQRDYRLARDRLEARLIDGQYGLLQLPTAPSVEASANWQAFTVACESYQLHEEERFGGFATFDINFVEAGQLPVSSSDWQNTLQSAIDNFLSQVQVQMSKPDVPLIYLSDAEKKALIEILKGRFNPPGSPNPQRHGQLSRFNRAQALGKAPPLVRQPRPRPGGAR